MQKSFIEIPAGHPFPLYNLPYGVFDYQGQTSIGVAIGDYVLNLSLLEEKGLLKVAELKGKKVFNQPTLNTFLEMGKPCWSAVRKFLMHFLASDTSDLRDNPALQKELLIPQQQVTMKMPVHVGGYTDFYSSLEHATNLGKMFRDPENPLLPNWKYIPVGYDGRASAIVVSGTKIKRPNGQLKIGDDAPICALTRQFDTEIELGFVVGTGNELGCPISINQAADHIFGAVILLDWSARDIQRWEYVPLGPFLGKNFGTTISPWIVTMEALAPFSTPGPVQDPKPLPYLSHQNTNFDIDLHLQIKTPKMDLYQEIAHTNYKYMYWDIAQQVAHHTVNGCNLRAGDILGTGTISGSTSDSYGSLIELTWGGQNPIHLDSGESRVYLEDSDSMQVVAFAKRDDLTIGFGCAEATVF
ncbi:MAG: fumarylacetoacetase [Pseudomonadota bacterium]|jgi:fumarylacetoacetase|nr:fumarylacetoacetase [Alphaproteobacteria bacterium]